MRLKNGLHIYNIECSHEYKEVWNALIDGTERSCKREPGKY